MYTPRKGEMPMAERAHGIGDVGVGTDMEFRPGLLEIDGMSSIEAKALSSQKAGITQEPILGRTFHLGRSLPDS